MFSTIFDRIRQSFKSEQEESLEIREITKKLKHVAIIADGNRRWAKKRGLSPLEGHKKGFEEVAPQVCKDLWDMGVHTVTIWCLSTNNWSRDKDEIDNLLLVTRALVISLKSIASRYNARIIHLGRKDRLPHYLKNLLEEVVADTSQNSSHIVNVGIDYGGSDEIVRVCRKLISEGCDSKAFTEELISRSVDSSGQPFPNPDLIIRSAGELRLSGFMMWESVYSELFFTNKCFPEFDAKLLKNAIRDYSHRKRTFSK